MEKVKKVKCRYAKCCHEEKELEKEDAIKVGSSYYHKDCYKTKSEIDEILKIWGEKINENVVYTQLRAIVNQIVFNKNVTSEQLLFYLKYYIENNITLRYPQGLYYVIQNKDVQEKWEKYNNKRNKQKTNKTVIDDTMNLEGEFQYKATKKKTIGDIFNE